ncbi:ganglioside GM2 activator-like [Mercenaria mercenaria]|uniref:ganglioside GM2 activator-like n=1 Tax=Mercenaria mercenaria TaxID=6596 RepID=UPI00234ECC81|nr:ganglioside GM2 activator-like [Mercenaria mercenaria]
MKPFVVLFTIFADVVFADVGVHEMEIGKGLQKFSWGNCNKTIVPLAFKTLSLSPDPIQYGQKLVVTAELDVTQPVGTTNTLKADIIANLIEGQEKFDMCQYKPDLCHIADLCYNISKIKIPCPKVVQKQGSDCKCPLKPNTYTATKIPIPIPSSSFQIQGTFEVTVNLSEQNKPVGCFTMGFCLG